jgi:hypothetical protein
MNPKRLFGPITILTAVLAMLTIPATAGSAAGTGSNERPAAGTPGSGCIGHAFGARYQYQPGCSGHDEPELDPLSDAKGSARDLTWTIVLPSDGSLPVADVGPTFWFGGTVADPNSEYGQAYLEMQFYPDAIVNHCTPRGGFRLTFAPNTYGVCTPVWKIDEDDREVAAFNAMLVPDGGTSSMRMYAGDRVQIHMHVVSRKQGWNLDVSDLTTRQTGTIVLNSADDGPLLPAFNRQKIGGSLEWGIVHDAPDAFVWEIGHTSDFTDPPAQFCLPGDPACDSYDAAHWAAFSPLQILSVRFGDGSSSHGWAVVSDYGGVAEIDKYCKVYGGPYCIYPWYARNAGDSHTYGVDYPGTRFNFGQAAQFKQDRRCPGVKGPHTTYCTTGIS